ncbi:MAG: Wzz/FepE/Etk N-terminal domain-containing protein [Lachnospiraceae bacterium]|nr:Wzz/FepE/Etk N-terminal domain-containing protein [Robinsoniella sp.]MDY3765648.1 Wzz/FepE/Etk N-terminal domain-containing protein [Lachnospiraceae bacterium]
MENISEQQRIFGYKSEEDIIDLREIVYGLLHRWKMILLAMLIGAVMMGCFHYYCTTSTYRSDAKLYITNTDSVSSISDLQLSAALTEDCIDIITSRTVLKQVIKNLNLNMDFKQLADLITVENPNSTHIIHIYVTCNDAELCRDIANTLIEISTDQIYQIVGIREPTIIDYAEAEAIEEITPGFLKYLLLGALAGLVFMCVILVLRILTDTTIKMEEDIEKYMNIPVLTTVPYDKEM